MVPDEKSSNEKSPIDNSPLKLTFVCPAKNISRIEVKNHFLQYGSIKKLYMKPDGSEGNLEFQPGADLAGALDSRLTVGDHDLIIVDENVTQLFLGGVPAAASEEDVLKAVRPYGTVVSYNRPMYNNHNAGFCFIKFATRS